MDSPARKVAYAAAAAAIATLAAIAAAYLPLTVTPYVLCAFCFYVAFLRCGWVYGFLTIAATALITFFAGGGIDSGYIMLLLIFVPYSVAAVLMKKLTYFKLGQALLRILIVAAVINVGLVCTYFTVVNVAMGGVDVLAAMDKVGGYAVLALIATVIGAATDFLFTQLSALVLKVLK